MSTANIITACATAGAAASAAIGAVKENQEKQEELNRHSASNSKVSLLRDIITIRKQYYFEPFSAISSSPPLCGLLEELSSNDKLCTVNVVDVPAKRYAFVRKFTITTHVGINECMRKNFELLCSSDYWDKCDEQAVEQYIQDVCLEYNLSREQIPTHSYNTQYFWSIDWEKEG